MSCVEKPISKHFICARSFSFMNDTENRQKSTLENGALNSCEHRFTEGQHSWRSAARRVSGHRFLAEETFRTPSVSLRGSPGKTGVPNFCCKQRRATLSSIVLWRGFLRANPSLFLSVFYYMILGQNTKASSVQRRTHMIACAQSYSLHRYVALWSKLHSGNRSGTHECSNVFFFYCHNGNKKN